MSCRSRFNSGVKSVFGKLYHLSPAVAFLSYDAVSSHLVKILNNKRDDVVKTQSNYDK